MRRDIPSSLLRGFAHWLAALWLTLTCSVGAIEQARLVIERLQAENWQAQGIRLQFAVGREAGELQVARVTLPEPIGELRALHIKCATLRFNDATLDCPRAHFQLKTERLDAEAFTGSFRYEVSTQKLQFQVNDLPLGGTRVKMSARLEDEAWWADLATPALSLSREDGSLATDKLALKLSLHARPQPDGWKFDLDLDAPQGQAYIEPVFLDLAQAPLHAMVSGQWRGPARQLSLESFRIEQPGVLKAQGAAMLDFAAAQRLQSLQLQIDEATLPGVYASYLQPFLIGNALDSLETQGRVSGSVGFSAGQAQHVRLKLDGVHMDDKKKRFALYGLNGQVDWLADPTVTRQTELQWEGGNAYRLDLGATALRVQTTGRDARLVEPVHVPVLDGGLDIRRLELSAVGTPAMRVAFDGKLAPMGMERLSRALGWPVFGGSLSGAIPTLEYHEGNLTVGGTLAANVFDGRVEVDNLRLQEPFGALPRLWADMKIRNIDLESATSAFSFGRIEGRLDGDVKNLRLLKWKPVAFDGRLYTPPDDDTRHRISQRAIENISDLGGGGAAGVVSRGFLRFFKDFGYDRLALGCRLQDGVCQMSGLEPHQSGGYYIVKGSLLPRIDVIGFANRVSWDGFVEQLKSATKSEGPVVK